MDEQKENEFELPSSLKEENVKQEETNEDKPIPDTTFNPTEALVKTTDFSSDKVFMESIKEEVEDAKEEKVNTDNKSKFMTIFTYITIAVVCFTLGGAFGYCIGNKSSNDNKTTIKEDKKEEPKVKNEE